MGKTDMGRGRGEETKLEVSWQIDAGAMGRWSLVTVFTFVCLVLYLW